MAPVSSLKSLFRTVDYWLFIVTEVVVGLSLLTIYLPKQMIFSCLVGIALKTVYVVPVQHW